jgi:hypothetical protein
VLATGIKDPQKDEKRLVLVGAFGRRPVTRVIYHPGLPIAKLAEGNLAPEDYLAMMRHDAAMLVVDDLVTALDAAAISDGDPSVGPASVASFKGDALPVDGPIEFQLAAATIGPRRASSPLAELRCAADASMEGAAVFAGGRLVGILLVNLGADGKPTTPHSILPSTRLREMIALP